MRIPSDIWKTFNYVDHCNKLVTVAYIFFQDTDTLRTTKARQRKRLRHFRLTTTELQLWTDLAFEKQMFDSKPPNVYGGPEAIQIKQLKDLSSLTEALLAAGVI